MRSMLVPGLILTVAVANACGTEEPTFTCCEDGSDGTFRNVEGACPGSAREVDCAFEVCCSASNVRESVRTCADNGGKAVDQSQCVIGSGGVGGMPGTGGSGGMPPMRTCCFEPPSNNGMIGLMYTGEDCEPTFTVIDCDMVVCCSLPGSTSPMTAEACAEAGGFRFNDASC